MTSRRKIPPSHTEVVRKPPKDRDYPSNLIKVLTIACKTAKVEEFERRLGDEPDAWKAFTRSRWSFVSPKTKDHLGVMPMLDGYSYYYSSTIELTQTGRELLEARNMNETWKLLRANLLVHVPQFLALIYFPYTFTGPSSIDGRSEVKFQILPNGVYHCLHSSGQRIRRIGIERLIRTTSESLGLIMNHTVDYASYLLDWTKPTGLFNWRENRTGMTSLSVNETVVKDAMNRLTIDPKMRTILNKALKRLISEGVPLG